MAQCLRADERLAARPCVSDTDCLVGGVVGRCLQRRVCAFADGACASRLRVMFHPGANGSGPCVPLGPDGGSPPLPDGGPPTTFDTLAADLTVDNQSSPLPDGPPTSCGSQGSGCCPTFPRCNDAKLICLENDSCSCVAALVSGGEMQCAIHTSKELSCWGANNLGQIAIPTVSPALPPTHITALSVKPVSVSLGALHGCAVSSTGTVLCWGDNSKRQLANTSGNASAVPMLVSMPLAKSVASGSFHACAISGNDGAVYCWGDNSSGQLSNAVSDLSTSVPTRVTDLPDAATIIAAGGTHTCASTQSGVYCWGGNDKGQLGAGNFGKTTAVEKVIQLTVGVKMLAIGASHSCALVAGGLVYCWGDNTFGQCGVGAGINTLSTPTQVPNASGHTVARIAVGDHHTCALLGNGQVYCWGLNDVGQVSASLAAQVFRPTLVPGVRDAVKLSLGGRHSCALGVGGTVQCWGANGAGQLGVLNAAPGSLVAPSLGCF